MRLCALFGLLLAGCYHPTVASGVPCDDNGACPTGQHCVLGTCTSGDTDHDSGIRDDAPIDARPIDAPIDAALHLWTTPVKLTELESGGSEADPSMTADRLTIVWASTRTGGMGMHDLWIATRPTVSDPFTNITNLAALNSVSNDQAPEISPDGKTVWFASDRAGTDDIYVSTFDGSQWSAPTIVAELSTMTAAEMELAVTPDLLTVVIDRDNRFYRATRTTTTLPWGVLTVIPELHISNDIASPTLGDNADVIYFHAGATRDLYVARAMVGGVYSTPVPVSELNTVDRDADPHINGAETFMVFNCISSICTTTRN